MSYTFKENINPKEYQDFIQNFDTLSFMQEPEWGNVKNNWNSILCGVYKNDKLVAGCQLLIRNVFRNISFIYVPRGYVLDFTNLELLSFLTDQLRKIAKREHAYLIKIDPNLCVSETLFKDPKIEFSHFYSNNYHESHKNLLSLGYQHTGFSKEMHHTFQPRYQMAAPLIDETGKPLSKEELLKSYKSKFRYYLGSYHEKRGVFFERSNNIKDLTEFVKMLKHTEETQGIVLRDEAYFKRILEEFKNRAYLIFGKVDLTKYLDFLKQNNGKEEEIKEVKELIKTNGNIMTLSSALLLLPGNKKIRTSEYLYAGNYLILPKLSVSAGVCFEALCISLENNCQYCNLGGVDGNLKDPLSVFKSKYNAVVFEFAGEYDLIISKFWYYAAKIGYPILKKLKH